MAESSRDEFRTSEVELEIRIQAAPDRVWRALVEQTVAWWPKHFYVGETARAFVIEPRVGGRVYEDWGEGQGALWATVTCVRRGEILEWAGDMAPDFGGPGRSLTSFRLEQHDGATVVRFRDAAYGRLAESALKGIEHGWRELLEGCFKPFVEEGRQPERPASVVG